MLQHGIQNQAISNMKESHLGISCFIISKYTRKTFKGKFSAIRTCRRNTHVKSSNLRQRRHRKIYRHIQSGGSICHDGEESNPDRLWSEGRFDDEPARWGTVKTGHELYERGRWRTGETGRHCKRRIWKCLMYRDGRTDTGTGLCGKRNHCHIPVIRRFEIIRDL